MPEQHKTPEEKAAWEKAKRIICKSATDGYKEACEAAERGEDSDAVRKFYALVQTVYQNIVAAKPVVNEEALAVFAEAALDRGTPVGWADILAGDRVSVFTVANRPVTTGWVTMVTAGAEMAADLGPQVWIVTSDGSSRKFPVDLYVFTRHPPEVRVAEGEADPKAISRRVFEVVGVTGAEDVQGLAQEVIRSCLPSADRRAAAALWSDIQSHGHEWAFRHHGTEASVAALILERLLQRGLWARPASGLLWGAELRA